MAFPKDFVWGTATSSYQIEGGGLDYGRGECIWHRFSHTPGKVYNGDTGDIACDHIHRYPQDVAMMAELGIDSYRFSVSWPRVIPAGTGTINQQGLDFYKRLIESLQEANITPYLTLYHWDLPQALQDKGGWENPDSVQWFMEYADLISRELGSDVKDWITHNEPFVVSMVSNLFGVHAPGQQDPVAAYTVAHHVLLSHGAAVPIIRQNVPDAEVGITLDQTYSMPYRPDNHEDQIAARRFAAFHNDWFLEPVFRGTYPADALKELDQRGALSKIDPTEISKAQVPIDFLGINYYTRYVIKASETDPSGFEQVRVDGTEHTALDWEVYPDGLLHTLLYLHNAYYPTKIYITENGCSYDDPLPINGVVDDPKRVDYYRQHIDAIEKAIELGVPVAGYFAWSLMDNFEWAEGYNRRFGLYHVDFETQERTPKKSALYYQERISQERAKA
ncbi:MAG: beta-glucosidase [Anaerolineaceae bacterium]|nr:beta-glucosidase [Anaerolineaceae bacterium]